VTSPDVIFGPIAGDHSWGSK
jgi:hypothetical protein